MRNVLRTYGKALSSALVAFAALKSGSAWAVCSLGPPGRITMTINGPANGIVVDSSIPPGETVNPGTGPAEPKTYTIVCVGGAGGNNPVYFKTSLIKEAVDNGYVYEFKVGGQPAGVGMVLTMSTDSGDFLPMPVTRQVNLPNSTNPGNNTPSYTGTNQFRAVMVRTANPVIYGTVDRGLGVGASNFYNGTGETGTPIQYMPISTGDISLVRPSCLIDSGSLNQTVELGSYSTRDLQNPTSATAWVPFEFVMTNCDDPTGRLVDVTFGSATDQDSNNRNLFSLNTGGPTGIGIALSTNDGADSAVLPGATNTFPGVATGGTYKFRARMERTSASLTAGEFSRPVTVLVNYR
jgi:major type 1 subunit fimbrin (pilin)